jgi:hypothetical protein
VSKLLPRALTRLTRRELANTFISNEAHGAVFLRIDNKRKITKLVRDGFVAHVRHARIMDIVWVEYHVQEVAMEAPERGLLGSRPGRGR